MRKMLLAAFAGIALAAPATARAVRVVATVTDLGAIAREVVGDAGNVTVLARSSQDPHFVDARPSLMLDLNRADMLLLVGADLEIGWLPVLVNGARNPRILAGKPGHVDASTLVPLKDVPAAKIDRSLGDIHPMGNPHITTDPDNGVRIARGFAERLALVDAANAEKYRANAAAFEKAAQARIAAWKTALAPFKGTPIVAYHASWVYFADFAGLSIVGYLEPKPGIPPNAPHLLELATLMKSRRVPLILQETWFGSSASEVLARETGAKLVAVPGTAREGQSYLDHVDELVKDTIAALARK